MRAYLGCMRRHGPVTRCAVTRTVEFMEKYIALDKGDPKRRALEAQYGKKNMERMEVEYKQEKENAAWLKERTMACPGCETHVEKSHGEWGGLDAT
jgi:E3 ubiquitin-protein ligase RNF14